MLLQGWAIALGICSAGILFLGLVAVVCAVRVLRYWDHGADTSRQIRLESETWLSSALMQYGLVFQLLSLVLLVLAADSFSSLLVGAMCATGAFMANPYGIPALLVKIVMVFFSGYWLLLHRLDSQSESYPLARLKYGYLLVLVPLLLTDGLLQFCYLYFLEPDVITSCCGVVFRSGEGDGRNLLDAFSTPTLLFIFYALAAGLLLLGLGIRVRLQQGHTSPGPVMGLFAVGWLLFFVVAIWAIIVVFSSYIYAMPHHRCPFDILQPEYGSIGYPIYLLLFAATFLGSGCGVAQLVRGVGDLAAAVFNFQSWALPLSLLLLTLFLLLTAYAPLSYILAGGES